VPGSVVVRPRLGRVNHAQIDQEADGVAGFLNAHESGWRAPPRTSPRGGMWRAQAYGEVLERVHGAAVWIPLYHEPMKIAYSAKLAPIRAHNIYGCGLYKGLDIRFAS
jgi:hypothetical protein